MNPGRQFIRWSIPGAILLLSVALDEWVLALIVGRGRESLTGLTRVSPYLAAVLFALAIPIGFLINSLYFLLYQRERFRPWSQPPDLGEDVSKNLAEVHPGSVVQGSGSATPTWRTIRALMYWGMRGDDRKLLLSEYDDRSDIFHALGGTQVAMWAGAAVCTAYNAWVHRAAWPHQAWTTAWVVLLWIALPWIVTVVLSGERRKTKEALVGVLVDGLIAGGLTDAAGESLANGETAS